METLTLSAPAKINYLLDVIGKRPDGYHELRMIMQRVNLCDTITITLTSSPGITVTSNSASAPGGPENIAWKAAQALLDHAGSGSGVTIDITKQIPVAAGLGGGSSDAASVLMGLNTLLQLDLSDRQLMDIGCRLGADVPFFIFRKCALAEGIGEVLTPMPEMPKCWILLINPGVPVSTAWVYRSLQPADRAEPKRLPAAFDSIDQVAAVLSNDLESVTIPAFPVIADIKTGLMDQGAAGSLMSGSGPTVFGIFESFSTAEAARRTLTAGTNWFSATVETI